MTGSSESIAATGRRAALARPALAGLLVLFVFVLQYRFVLVNFSHGAPLLDAGWAAYFLGAGDFWTHYPRVLGGASYFNTHIYVYAGLLGMVMHALGVDGVIALALHQGFAFALLAGGLLLLTSNSGRGTTLLMIAAGIFGSVSDLVLQIACYPHIEIVTTSYCLAGSLLMIGRRPLLAALVFAVACLVREDGGLYAACFIVGTLVVSAPLPRSLRAVLAQPYLWLAAACFLYALAVFVIRERYFPGYDVFGDDFSGGDWHHLTPVFLLQHIGHVLISVSLLITLVALAWLSSRYSWRYATFFILVLPLVLLHLVARRDIVANFGLYYAIPWLDMWLGMFMVAALRGRRGELTAREPKILLVAAILGAAPAMALVGLSTSGFVLSEVLTRDAADIPTLKQGIRGILAGQPQPCVSQSIAALVPDDVSHEQAIWDDADRKCGIIVGFGKDDWAPRMAAIAAQSGLTSQQALDGRLIVYAPPASPRWLP